MRLIKFYFRICILFFLIGCLSFLLILSKIFNMYDSLKSLFNNKR